PRIDHRQGPLRRDRDRAPGVQWPVPHVRGARMTWAKVDDRWPRHPKAIAVGPLGRDLYVCGLCYCNEHLTDGFIPDDAVATLALPGPGNRHNRFTSVSVTLQKLLDAHLWERVQGGYRVHDYLDWNPTAERIRELRQKKKNRQDRWRRDAS